MPRPKLNDYLRLCDVPEFITRITGVTRTKSTVYQWIKFGRRGYDGRIVKMKCTKRLGQRFTTEAWVREFIEGL